MGTLIYFLKTSYQKFIVNLILISNMNLNILCHLNRLYMT